MTDSTASTASPMKLIWFFGIAGALLIFVLIASYASRMADDTTDYDQQRATERYATLAKVRADDEKTLTTADWIDQTKGTVRIPIDEAIPEEINTLKAKPVQMGAAIPGAAPAGQMNMVPAAAQNGAPAGATNAAPSTNAAPTTPTSAAPNK